MAGRRARKSEIGLNTLLPDDSVLEEQGGIHNIRVYKELLRDDQVGSTFQQRRRRVVQTETMVDPGAEDALVGASREPYFANEELPNLCWDDITDKQLFGVFYGWTVAEIIWKPNIDGRRV